MAIIACLINGELLTAAVVSTIMVLGALIEEVTAESARKSIQTLIKVSPKTAVKRVDGKEVEVAVEGVQVGDLLLVKPGDFSRAVAVLIVGCPCALILAVPTATVAAIGRAARAGILVKGGQHIENVALADTIYFDKTGTLTEGNQRVDEIVSLFGISADELLRQAANVECNSTHPLARGVIQAAHYAKISFTAARDLCTEIGLGVRGRVDGSLVEVGSVYLYGGIATAPQALQPGLEAVKQRGVTPLLVYRDKQALGFLNVSDRVRGSAALAVAKLRKLGLAEIGILSGDHQQSVDLVGREAGINRLWAGLTPDDKLKRIQEREDRWHFPSQDHEYMVVFT